MSVLIKGMEMPRSCNECPMSVGGYCIMSPKPNGDALNRHETTLWCPLVEVPTPHGKLIDADVLEREMVNGIKAGNLEEGYEDYANINNVDDCVECVRYADTIIEAEGENEKNEYDLLNSLIGKLGPQYDAVILKAVSELKSEEWIPCDKALPKEESETYLVSTNSWSKPFLCVWTNDSRMIDRTLKNGWGWDKYMLGEYVWCDSVTAWKPLPRKYKKQRSDKK